MKSNLTPRLPTGAALALLTLLNSGCTSIRARTEMPENDWNVYPGVRRDVSELGDAFTGNLKGPAWSPVLVAPILVADMPFSATMDTVALPYDLYRVSTLPEQAPKP
jgi:uncharacterized protein YceK